MIQLTPQMRILLFVKAVDFRKGIDGLAGICRDVLKTDPFSGYVFVFRNRCGTAVSARLRFTSCRCCCGTAIQKVCASVESFPEEVAYVIDRIALVYKNDDTAKKRICRRRIGLFSIRRKAGR